jgi:hypothetical protein
MDKNMMLELSNKSININDIRRIDHGVDGCVITWTDSTIEIFQGIDADKIKELSPENFIFRRIDFICLMLALKYTVLSPEALVNKSTEEKLEALVDYANRLEITPDKAWEITSDYRNIIETKLFVPAGQELMNLLEAVL